MKEIIRSSQLPNDILSGTKLFCIYRNGRFFVESRWETFKNFSNINAALEYFESFLVGGVIKPSVTTKNSN